MTGTPWAAPVIMENSIYPNDSFGKQEMAFSLVFCRKQKKTAQFRLLS